jgi:mRNA interferase MazF
VIGKRWDVVNADFGVPVGHEQGKHRPALVISNDGFNRATNMATVLPITSQRTTPKYPSEVALPKMPGIVEAGVIMIQQIRTISADRITSVRGPAKDPVLQREVKDALWTFLGFTGE